MKRLYLIVLMLLPFSLWAQESEDPSIFSMSAQLRARGEYRNGSLYPRVEGQLPATFINNRSRFTMSYLRSDLELKISGQHVGVWGQDPQIDKDGRFMLNEAWVKLKFKHGLFAQLGRQALVYDDERILGSLDWNVSGRFHDLLKLGFENEANKLHLMLAFNQNQERVSGTFYEQGGQPYKYMQTLWYHYGKPNQPFGISLMAMNLGWQYGTEQEEASNKNMQTFGTFATYKVENWDFNASVYYQTGENKAGRDVSAYMGSILAKLNLNSRWALGVGSDYLSGTDEGGTYGAFDPLYGTHHKFYGTMDYFYTTSFINGLNPGLWDNQLILSYNTTKKIDMSVSYHYFRTVKQLELYTTKLDRYLGSEVDLQLNWSIMPDVKLIAGYSFMFGTETMDYVKGGDHKVWQDWGWITLNISPNLFTTKKNK